MYSPRIWIYESFFRANQSIFHVRRCSRIDTFSGTTVIVLLKCARHVASHFWHTPLSVCWHQLMSNLTSGGLSIWSGLHKFVAEYAVMALFECSSELNLPNHMFSWYQIYQVSNFKRTFEGLSQYLCDLEYERMGIVQFDSIVETAMKRLIHGDIIWNTSRFISCRVKRDLLSWYQHSYIRSAYTTIFHDVAKTWIDIETVAVVTPQARLREDTADKIRSGQWVANKNQSSAFMFPHTQFDCAALVSPDLSGHEHLGWFYSLYFPL